MKKLIAFAVTLSTSVWLVSPAHAGSGKILTDTNGMTLYTFDKDTDGVSVCYGSCAKKWPPFIVEGQVKAKKGWAIITRQDGAKQWAFNGQPLYTWVGDSKKGDTNGDGIKGVWHIARKNNRHSSYDHAYEEADY